MGKNSGRNTALYNKALKCGNYIAGAGLNEAVAIEVLLDVSRCNGLGQEDGESSVLASIRSGIKTGVYARGPCQNQESGSKFLHHLRRQTDSDPRATTTPRRKLIQINDSPS
jgi:hypothetical protein